MDIVHAEVVVLDDVNVWSRLLRLQLVVVLNDLTEGNRSAEAVFFLAMPASNLLRIVEQLRVLLAVHHYLRHEGYCVPTASLNRQIRVHVVAEALDVVVVEVLLVPLGVLSPVSLLLHWVLVGRDILGTKAAHQLLQLAVRVVEASPVVDLLELLSRLQEQTLRLVRQFDLIEATLSRATHILSLQWTRRVQTIVTLRLFQVHLVNEHVRSLKVGQSEAPGALSALELFLRSPQAPVYFLHPRLLLRLRLTGHGVHTVAFHLAGEHVVEREGLQAAHVRLEDVIELLHGQEVLLDEKVGYVVLLVEDQVDQVVDHGGLLDSQQVVILVSNHGHALLVNAHARRLPRIPDLARLSRVLYTSPLYLNLQRVSLGDLLPDRVSLLDSLHPVRK